MNGNKAVLDSNILIYASKEVFDIDAVFKNYSDFYISVITYMEVLGYTFKNRREENIIQEIIGVMKVVRLNDEIISRVINLRKSHKIKLPDTIILATAEFLKADLLTENIADFKSIHSVISEIKNIL